MEKDERRRRRKKKKDLARLLAWHLWLGYLLRWLRHRPKKEEEEERREERRKEEERREERRKEKYLLCSSRLGFGDRGLGLSPLYGSVVLLAHVAAALARLVDGLLVRW